MIDRIAPATRGHHASVAQRLQDVHRRSAWTIAAACSLFGFAPLIGLSPDTLALAQSAATAEPERSTFDAELALETFDRTWTIVRDTHFDPDLNGVDWNAVRNELRPKAEAAADNDALRAVLNEMIGRLGQSHFGIIPGEVSSAINAISEKEASETVVVEDDDDADDADDGDDAEAAGGDGGEGDLGFDIRIADDLLLVWKVDDDGPAAAAGIQPGWEVEKIGRTEVSDVLERWPADGDNRMLAYQLWAALSYRFTGEVGTTIDLLFRDADDEPVELTLKRRPVEGTKVMLGGLPAMYASLEYERLSDPAQTQGAEIGLIGFTVWMTPIARPFDRAMDALRDTDGIIIDLRGNPGGLGFMTSGIAGHFIADRVSLGTMTTRETDLEFRVNPRFASTTGERVEPFSGPLALLIDGYSASTSEIFAAGLQDLGRVRIFGQTTPGAALPAMTSGLPNGDVLLHAIGDFIPPSGTSVEGRGVVPDEIVPVRRADLLADRDTPLLAAIQWIAAGGPMEDAADASPTEADVPATVVR